MRIDDIIRETTYYYNDEGTVNSNYDKEEYEQAQKIGNIAWNNIHSGQDTFANMTSDQVALLKKYNASSPQGGMTMDEIRASMADNDQKETNRIKDKVASGAPLTFDEQRAVNAWKEQDRKKAYYQRERELGNIIDNPDGSTTYRGTPGKLYPGFEKQKKQLGNQNKPQKEDNATQRQQERELKLQTARHMTRMDREDAARIHKGEAPRHAPKTYAQQSGGEKALSHAGNFFNKLTGGPGTLKTDAQGNTVDAGDPVQAYRSRITQNHPKIDQAKQKFRQPGPKK